MNALSIGLRSVAAHERDHKGNADLAGIIEYAANEIDRLEALANLQGQEIRITRERDEALEDAGQILIDEISSMGTHQSWKRLANLLHAGVSSTEADNG